MYDSLLNLYSGTLTGAPGAQGGKMLGRNRTFRAIGRCGGDATVGATATFAFEESNTPGSGYAAIAGAPSLVVTEQVGGFATSPTVRPSPEIPSSVSPLPSATFTTTKDYVRVNITLGGTTPTLPGVSVSVEPLDAALLPSGR